MSEYDILPWLEPLLKAPFVWQEVGSAGGIRAKTSLRDSTGTIVGYFNLVTAIAAVCGKVFCSADYHDAALYIAMPQGIAGAVIRAGDNNLPQSNKYFVPLSTVVRFLLKGGNL